jgi:hypothetical protein
MTEQESTTETAGEQFGNAEENHDKPKDSRCAEPKIRTGLSPEYEVRRIAVLDS